MIEPVPTITFVEKFNEEAKKAFENKENWHICSPDVPPCAVCKKLIWGFPLRLFGEHKEIDFHFDCTGMDWTAEEKDDEEFGREFKFVECEYCEKYHSCNFISDEQKKTVKYKMEDLTDE